jgi:hypothetical protein
MMNEARFRLRPGWTAVAVAAALSLSACGEAGPVAPEDAAAPELGAAGGNRQDRGPIERVQFIHWKKGFAKGGGQAARKGASSCYAFIARGAKWKTVEPWEVLSGTSDDGIGANAVLSAAGTGVGEWESYGGNIAGGGSIGSTPVNLNATDGKNVVQFGNDPRAGVIAVTNVWGFFSGPARTREIVEWDMILDRDFDWSNSSQSDPGAMDLLNIVVHELGHAWGMGHPSDSCTEETMYRFATEGEIKKRDLNTGDIAGIRDLY